ncbi:hypothetical protein IEQ34_008159 [Dendrobium chrysotoxum]|uniref:Uncharacterized protein n=1 Tax=Dendrobium chrysotoxum TaxID=161865 RepID=A0AAV7H5D7_DENCH|nr:hypothetical protein IEQ34_007591 [Dendrobium chrysotoxum]KAH0463577.1 hypothetical protein IEQ34_008159 [Dendrobium chrysotoxum]
MLFPLSSYLVPPSPPVAKWNVFPSPILENMGNRISLIILRDYAVLMIAKVTNKKRKILTSEGLEDDDCM